MDLYFLGRGAAFNPKEGNTSAYFIENNKIFLIDCGESIFERLSLNGILEDIEEINLMITHTHSDHIGSIGSLAMYSFYNLHKPLNIIIPTEAKYLEKIENILTGFDCDKEMYNYVSEKDYDNKYKTFENIRFLETRHRGKLICYSIIFNTDKGIIYYSGDTNEVDTIKKIIESKEQIDKIYIDTTTDDYPNNVHLNINILNKEIPKDLKKHTYCMHINNDKCIERAQELGFNVVEIAKKKILKK